MEVSEDDNGEMKTQGSGHLKSTDNGFAWGKVLSIPSCRNRWEHF